MLWKSYEMLSREKLLVSISPMFYEQLLAAFARIDPKSLKRYKGIDWIPTLLGSAHIKVAHKYVDEMTPIRTYRVKARLN